MKSSLKSIFANFYKKFWPVFILSFENREKKKREKLFVKKKGPSQPELAHCRPETSPASSRTAHLSRTPLSLPFLLSLADAVLSTNSSESEPNPNKLELIRRPAYPYKYPTSSASFGPKNPSTFAARPRALKPTLPPPAAGKSSSSGRLRRPLPPSSPPLASPLHGAPPRHHSLFFFRPQIDEYVLARRHRRPKQLRRAITGGEEDTGDHRRAIDLASSR